MRIGDILRHTNHSPDLKVGSVKCFDLYIIVLVLISKDLGNKQICWTILANLWPTSGTVWLVVGGGVGLFLCLTQLRLS